MSHFPRAKMGKLERPASRLTVRLTKQPGGQRATHHLVIDDVPGLGNASVILICKGMISCAGRSKCVASQLNNPTALQHLLQFNCCQRSQSATQRMPSKIHLYTTPCSSCMHDMILHVLETL